MATETVTFYDAGVYNPIKDENGADAGYQYGIDITQGMIDNVANPFLDLDAIVTQFKFKDNSVTVKIPAGTTVRYGNNQCTLEDDVTATLTPSNLKGDCHATTTSGTVLSGTTLDSGQLITTSGEWSVVLNSSVKVKTQDGYAILGTTDLNELSGGTTVSLSGGTNVCAVGEITIDEKTKKTSQFYFLADVTYHQIVLQELYDTLEALKKHSNDLTEYNENMDKLLNLCLLSGTYVCKDDICVLAKGVERTVDDQGNYVYTIIGGAIESAGIKIPTTVVNDSFSKQDATAGMALPYFALAIMYEKTCIQQMILVEQLKQIEKINDEIRENNRALKALTELYDRVYTVTTWSAKYEDVKDIENSEYKNLCYVINLDGCEMSVDKLNEYLKETVQNGGGLGEPGTVDDFNNVNADSYKVDDNEFITVVGRYDREGNNMLDKYNDVVSGKKHAEEDFDSNTSNIDVKEQATLTHISNLQDQVRMYGDSLSTDAQLMTTKMEQYMQDANACVSACTQTVKSIGDYWKNIITNIR